MPRLSVDIDLTYLPVAPRPESLAAINAAMKRMAESLRSGLRGARVTEVINAREKIVTKLNVQRGDAQIKIEVTPVLRGCVFESEIRSVSPSVEETFGYAQMQVVSFADLYAGKIVAALDRQHPRDLFDVRDLLANEGITDDLRKAFIVYLISHDRPISEIIVPRRKDIAQEFTHGFEGMTAEAVALKDLLEAREALISAIAGDMTDAHKEVSFRDSSAASPIGISLEWRAPPTCPRCAGNKSIWKSSPPSTRQNLSRSSPTFSINE